MLWEAPHLAPHHLYPLRPFLSSLPDWTCLLSQHIHLGLAYLLICALPRPVLESCQPVWPQIPPLLAALSITALLILPQLSTYPVRYSSSIKPTAVILQFIQRFLTPSFPNVFLQFGLRFQGFELHTRCPRGIYLKVIITNTREGDRRTDNLSFPFLHVSFTT